jgi:Ca2+-dependent lipid-binding protein
VTQACGALPLFFGTVLSWSTQHTIWIQIMLLIINGVTLVIIFIYVPESPKFLYSAEKYEQCRQVLSKVARVNNYEGNGK